MSKIYKVIIPEQEFEVIADDENEAFFEAQQMVEITNIEYIGDE